MADLIIHNAADRSGRRRCDAWRRVAARWRNRRCRPSSDGESAPTGAEVIDARGLMLAPGLIDLMAFCGEPGANTARRCGPPARQGGGRGVTTVVCRPDKPIR